MSTVNFSVPEEVKVAFNETFEGQNKSAVIAALMMEAVERQKRKQRSRDAFERILERRNASPKVSARRLNAARRVGRE